MVPVDLSELILQVMLWHPEFAPAFITVSGPESHVTDLHVTITAALCLHALNVGYASIISLGTGAHAEVLVPPRCDRRYTR